MEDLELAVRAAVKAKQTAESEAAEASAALEESTRARNDAAERALMATREAAAARAQLDDAEEEAAEVCVLLLTTRKYVTLHRSPLEELFLDLAGWGLQSFY